jgi:CheY-like chemotaxis protein
MGTGWTVATGSDHPIEILVVEDDGIVRELLVSVLARLGYPALGLASGQEALAFLRDAPVALRLILLDWSLFGMDCRAFRAEQLRIPSAATIPVELCSGCPDLPEHAAELGVAGYLHKPFNLDMLLRIVALHCHPPADLPWGPPGRPAGDRPVT